MNIPQNIIVHHSITPRDLEVVKTESSINRGHQNRGFPRSASGWYIGYHYIIYGDGTVRQYRRDDEVGAHCNQQSMNFRSIGICLAGNFDNPSSTPLLKSEVPSAAQITRLRELLQRLRIKYNIPVDRVVPHRHYAPKSCYGNVLADNWAQLIAGTDQQDMTNLHIDQAKILIKKLYGYQGAGLLKRVEDPETTDAAAFTGRVTRLMQAGDNWMADLAAQAGEIAMSSEFITNRIKIV